MTGSLVGTMTEDLSPAERYTAARRRAAEAATALAPFRDLYDFALDEFQLDACRALEAGSGVLVAAPTAAWYGDTPGPYQHFRQAQVRAVEQGLPLIRAANNGLSAVVDAYGRITDGLAHDAVGVIDAYLPSTRAPFWGTLPGSQQSLVALLTLLAVSVVFRLPIGRRFH